MTKITTVKVTHTEASVIRCVARKDMEEYGLKEGQVFYLAKSASMTGYNQYHIVTWDYANSRWNCPCEFGNGHNHKYACKHTNAVSVDCCKHHVVQGYKPYTRGEKFALLLVKYDIRFQPSVIEAEEVADEAFSKPIESVADKGVLNNANVGFSILKK